MLCSHLKTPTLSPTFCDFCKGPVLKCRHIVFSIKKIVLRAVFDDILIAVVYLAFYLFLKFLKAVAGFARGVTRCTELPDNGM